MYEGYAKVDLELKLSLPGSNSDNLLNFNSRTPLSLSSQRAFLPSKMDIEKNLEDAPKDELPPLIAMGCSMCLIYVMVSKAQPKCPICKNSDLVNKVQRNPPKKIRTSWY